jgi:hypothetical protein
MKAGLLRLYEGLCRLYSFFLGSGSGQAQLRLSQEWEGCRRLQQSCRSLFIRQHTSAYVSVSQEAAAIPADRLLSRKERVLSMSLNGD